MCWHGITTERVSTPGHSRSCRQKHSCKCDWATTTVGNKSSKEASSKYMFNNVLQTVIEKCKQTSFIQSIWIAAIKVYCLQVLK